jgi:sodium/pantothenate symporter
MPPGFPEERNYLPISLGFSFFFVWVFAGLGSPAGMVRVMACKNTATIRRSIFLLSAYNMLIYIPLVLICICGRAIVPDLPPTMSDEIIPRLALKTTSQFFGGSVLAGLILTAPFGAVMATVSSYLVVIASGLVRDIYQRFIRPDAGDGEIKTLTYGGMIIVGAIAVGANIRPVEYLQHIVVFSGTSAAASFVVPALMTAYWRRATSAGVIAAMLGGCATMMTLFAVGTATAGKFGPYYLLGMEPIIWGLPVSLLAGIVVSLCTQPPPEEVVSRLFDAQVEETAAIQTAAA